MLNPKNKDSEIRKCPILNSQIFLILDILRAESPKGAVGPAQFMPNTAKEMGINIDHYEDERMSPSIALPAMAEYLDDRIDQFGGNVYLGLAAYNWGPGNVESRPF